MKKTVLISSVGSLVGQNVLDALENRRQNLRIIGANSVADAGGNYRCDKAFIVPEATQGALYRQSLANLMDAEGVDLVIPGRDADVLALAQLREERPEWAGRLMVGALAAAQVMDDKVASDQFSQQRSLPFAPTVSSDEPDARQAAMRLHDRYGFPLIAKPRYGDGSRGIRVLTQASHLERAVQQPGLAIQPMLDVQSKLELDLSDGLPFFWALPESRLYASQSLIDANGSMGAVFGFISVMVAGRCERITPCTDPDLVSISKAFGAAMAQIGWRGPFNLQLKRDAKMGLQAIEMNGRFSGGTSARRYLGFDEVAVGINQWLQGAIVPIDHPAVGVNCAVNKSLSDFAIPSAGLQSMEETGQWSNCC